MVDVSIPVQTITPCERGMSLPGGNRFFSVSVTSKSSRGTFSCTQHSLNDWQVTAMNRFRTRLWLQVLEDRDTPTTFTVMNTLDSGAGSLRQAVIDANNAAGADTIAFDPSVTGTI